jgi:hypothetical protein
MVGNLTCCLRHCDRRVGHDATSLLAVLRQAGGELVSAGRRYGPTTPDDYLLPSGSTFTGLAYRHPLLELDQRWLSDFNYFQIPTPQEGIADCAYFADTNSFALTNVVWNLGPAHTERLAGGLHAWLATYAALFRPRFAYIDWVGLNLTGEITTDPATVCYLYWTNYYSPDLASRIGSGLFSAAPQGAAVSSNNGSVLYTVTDSFGDWTTADVTSLIAYLRTRLPNVERYVPEPFDRIIEE